MDICPCPFYDIRSSRSMLESKRNSKSRCYQVVINFQSCDQKQRYDKATDELLCSNLLSWLSGQAREKYHGNPPNILVICKIFAEYFFEYLSPAIQLLLCLLPRCVLFPIIVVLFSPIPSLFAEIHSPSLSETALWQQSLSWFEP